MTAAEETALGVDVGGTRIRIARIDRAGAIEARASEPVRRDREGFLAQLLGLVERLRTDTTLAIGIGIPGRVDGASGTIASAGYLDIAGLDLRAHCAALGLAARVENDATMALFAEARQRQEDGGVIAMLTVGTGIGGALLQDGAPWYGGGFAGQFGHIVVAGEGPVCNCGRIGCVETLSSGTALQRLIEEARLDPPHTIEAILARAAGGEPAATAILEAWSAPFQRALETLVAAVDPRLIVVGGGLGGAMTEALGRRPRQAKWFALPVEAARLGDDAGIAGAAICGFSAVREAVS